MTFKSWESRLGFCSWSVRPESIDDLLSAASQIGLKRVQLHLNPLCDEGKSWFATAAKLQKAGIAIGSGMVGCVGEDYTTIESIHRTGGVVPDDTWPSTFTNLHIAAPLIAALGIERVTMHAGFIPSDTADPIYAKVLDRIRKVADLFGGYGASVALETGQEAAPTLKRFFQDVERENVFINFDPANMLLYGSGDPIDALKLLLPHVGSCHIKDGVRSAKTGEWGEEVPVGKGQVPWKEFFAVLDDGKFAGDLMIEREAGEQRILDIRHAVDELRTLGG
ncbi:MAG: sugar phosphate isomerase/epimerase family protein [Pirellulales bacterium]